MTIKHEDAVWNRSKAHHVLLNPFASADKQAPRPGAQGTA